MGKGRKDPATYEDPSHSMGFLTRIAFRAFARALERRTMARGISSGQWRFLRALWLEDGITQRELSRRVGLREPTTVSAVKSLESSDLVTRVPCEQDRRRVHIHLTAKGRRLQRTLMPAVAEVNAIATEGISDGDLAITRRVLLRVRDNLAKDTADPVLDVSEDNP